MLPGCTLGTQERGSPPSQIHWDTRSLPGTNCPHPQGSPPGGGGSSRSSSSRIRSAGTRAAMAGRRTDRRTDGQKQEGLRCGGSLSYPYGHRFLAPPLAACSGNPARRRERRGGERGQGGGADAPPSLRARPTSRGHAETPAPSGGGGACPTPSPPPPPDVAFCARDNFSPLPPPRPSSQPLARRGSPGKGEICILTLGRRDTGGSSLGTHREPGTR